MAVVLVTICNCLPTLLDRHAIGRAASMHGGHCNTTEKLLASNVITKELEKFPHTGRFLAGRFRHDMSEDEKRILEDSVSEVAVIGKSKRILEHGEVYNHSTMLIEGFVVRTIDGPEARHGVSFHVPGDFVDLHGFALKRLDHGLMAVSDVKVGVVPHTSLERVMTERPQVARAMWFATLLDAALHRKCIQMLERLDAARRIAHIYCELQSRLGFTDRATNRAVRAPFTQAEIAGMCGVSLVHVNRAVSKLRELGSAEIRRGTLYTSDWAALRQYAEFDPSYLYGDGHLKLNEGWD